MTPRQANVLTVVGLVALLAVVSLTAPRWSALLREPLTVFDGNGMDVDTEATPSSPDGADAGRRINVRLYFEAPTGDGLVSEEREIAFSEDLPMQLRTVVNELVRGPTSGLVPTLPDGTRVLEVFVTERGVAYVNLSGEATGLPGGSRAELLTVYSVINSLVVNFPAVSRVQLLVEDRMTTSFAGHVDVSRPLPADMTLVVFPTLGDARPDPEALAETTP
jgi:spore germination protein GerM